jgi:hypothetical protein
VVLGVPERLGVVLAELETLAVEVVDGVPVELGVVLGVGVRVADIEEAALGDRLGVAVADGVLVAEGVEEAEGVGDTTGGKGGFASSTRPACTVCGKGGGSGTGIGTA